MKFAFFLFLVSFAQLTSAQKTLVNSSGDTLVFKVLDYGPARVKAGTTEQLSNSPTGTHGWLDDFEMIRTSDSIQAVPKANFGVVYVMETKDTVNINVTIEWIYPTEIKNDKGETFKTIKYNTKRPTNIPSASSYSLDEPYEMVKGDWQVNIYIGKALVCSKVFHLY